MTFKTTVLKNRSYRLYDHTATLSLDQISQWLDLVHNTASSRNIQALKFAVSYTPKTNDAIFDTLTWAGYLPEFNPSREQGPTAYVILMADRQISTASLEIDLGITAQTLLLAATDANYGGCMLAAFNKKRLKTILNLPDHLEPLLVIALGKPAETCHLYEMKENNYKYHREGATDHFVPKRPLSDLILPLK